MRQWGRFLGDATLTAAILDRLAMHAIRIDIDGPSYRQHVAAERSGQAAPPPHLPRREAEASRSSPPTTAPLTVPDLVGAPELAAIILLEHALDVAAECPRRRAHDPHRRLPQALRAGARRLPRPYHLPARRALRDTLVRYRRAVRDAAASHAENTPDDDLPF